MIVHQHAPVHVQRVLMHVPVVVLHVVILVLLLVREVVHLDVIQVVTVVLKLHLEYLEWVDVNHARLYVPVVLITVRVHVLDIATHAV